MHSLLDVMALAGCCLIVAGVARFSPAAALIVAGVELLVIANLTSFSVAQARRRRAAQQQKHRNP